MKYIASRECQMVTDALNFSTLDCHIIGSCDLYTTKAAGGDKRLYKEIDNTLESQHESLVRLSASLSPPQMPMDGKSKKHNSPIAMPHIDLSRDSPFGPLSNVSARRVFAYLIATLNASHPDYEFSNSLRPLDFQRTTGTLIRKEVDSMMLHLRPRRMPQYPASRGASSAPGVPSTDAVWGEHMWALIDMEMNLRQCDKYVWKPEDDPFEDEGSLWSQHYFFFNKDKKRVCYLYFGAYSVLSYSPARTQLAARANSMPRGEPTIVEGAGKRAQYYFGRSLDDDEFNGSWKEDDDVEGEYTEDLDDIRDHLEDGYGYYNYADDGDGMEDDDASGWLPRDKSDGRSHSEDMADAMDI